MNSFSLLDMIRALIMCLISCRASQIHCWLVKSFASTVGLGKIWHADTSRASGI